MYDNSKQAIQPGFEVKLHKDGSVDVDHYINKAHALRSECITDMLRSLFISNKPKQQQETSLGSLARERIQVLGYQKMTLEF